MIKLGYKLMSEEHGPSELVRNLVRAEQAGFDLAAISDHFSPWIEEQGHAPLAWSVLGALAQATTRIALMTAVTCPIMRYHPAIVAQGAATVALLSDNRFTLGLGAGERLNEHIAGAGWPGLGERHERLSEAIDIIQGLLSGDLSNFRGRYFRLDQARLFVPACTEAAGGGGCRWAGGGTAGRAQGRRSGRHRAEAGADRGFPLGRRRRAALCRGVDVLGPLRGGGAADGAPLLPLGGHRLACAGGTAEHARLRGGDAACHARGCGAAGEAAAPRRRFT